MKSGILRDMDIIEIVRLLVIYVIAITIHEFSHAWAGHQLGDPTARLEGRLTLNPAAHIDPLTTLALPFMLLLIGSPIIFGAARPVPFNPYMVRYGRKGAALIALAGPGSNILLALLVGIIVRVLPNLASFGDGLLINLLVINIALALFNLIPIPPLDGSRVVYAFAPTKVMEAMERFERTGPIALLVIFFVVYPFIAPYISLGVSTFTKLILGI